MTGRIKEGLFGSLLICEWKWMRARRIEARDGAFMPALPAHIWSQHLTGRVLFIRLAIRKRRCFSCINGRAASVLRGGQRHQVRSSLVTTASAADIPAQRGSAQICADSSALRRLQVTLQLESRRLIDSSTVGSEPSCKSRGGCIYPCRT